MNKTYSDYLFVPKYMFNKLVYPVFTSGTGYLVPWWALPCLYRESQVLTYFFITDVFVCGFVTNKKVVTHLLKTCLLHIYYLNCVMNQQTP